MIYSYRLPNSTSLARCVSFVLMMVIHAALMAQLSLDEANSTTINTRSGGGTSAWGDLDNDGDADLVISLLGYRMVDLYYNNNGILSASTSSIFGTNDGNIDLADYDSDGDLDIIISRSKSFDNPNNFLLKLYKNDNGNFIDNNTAAGLPHKLSHLAVWGDYDNDGDPDLATIMKDNLNKIRGIIYKNDNGYFTKTNHTLPIAEDGAMDWGDYDNDGDLDLIIAGFDRSSYTCKTAIYKNENGDFIDIEANLPGIYKGSVSWGDVNNDGKLDIAITGSTVSFDINPAGSPASFVLLNNGNNTFSDINAVIPGVSHSSSEWEDYDKDGDIDLMITGITDWFAREAVSMIYRNDDGTLVNSGINLPATMYGEGKWADYDNDDKPDLLLIGKGIPGAETQKVRQLYHTKTPSPVQETLTLNGAASDLFENKGESMVDWGDFDNDGDLDLIAIGMNSLGEHSTKIYENVNDGFTIYTHDLPNISSGSVQWGDYDGDGDLDVLLVGVNETGVITKIYKNDEGVFKDLQANLSQVGQHGSGHGIWGDYDRDGDLDLVISGLTTNLIKTTTIYRNNEGTFTDIDAGITPVIDGWADWGDYDRDGDLDLAITGDGNFDKHTTIYTNDNGIFSNSQISLTGVGDSKSVHWGDYDQDGDLDLIVGGMDINNELHNIIYQNNNGSFTDINAGLAGSAFGTAMWGDFDKDNDLDLLIVGDSSPGSSKTRIYKNESGTFIEISHNLPAVFFGAARWADFDQDHDLDIAVTGYNDLNAATTFQLWNNNTNPNLPPDDIILSNNTVNQSAGITAFVGHLSASDPNNSDSHNFVLAETDIPSYNFLFSISGNNLYIRNSEIPAGTYPIYVTTNDGHQDGFLNKILNIEVIDDIAPILKVKTATLHLNSEGLASALPNTFDDGSYDPGGEIAQFSIIPKNFNCSHIGSLSVTLAAVDAHGNSTTTVTNLTIIDNQTPLANAKNITLALNSQGVATLSPEQIDNESTDNCQFTLSVDHSLFTCDNLGENTVTLSATDPSGNSATATATVTIVDHTPPRVNAKNITLALNSQGTASLSPEQIDNESTDNCQFTLSVDRSLFTCDNLGENTVTLSATDPSGNSATATATVTIVDHTPPRANAKNITLALNSQGTASLSPEQIDNESTDNCQFTLSVDHSLFTCDNLGENTVTLSATDPSGNSATATATVTIVDHTPPRVNAKNITLALNSQGTASLSPEQIDNESTDNCQFTLSVDRSLFTCDNLGENTVTLSATDPSGNSATATATVTIVDHTPPRANAKNITLALNSQGTASLSPEQIDNESTDNCQFTLSVDRSLFTCDNLGENTVTLSATDPSGNSATATATVTIVDHTPPIITTEQITLTLNNEGVANLNSSNLLASDNCNMSVSFSQDNFNCEDIGNKNITVTATDREGNTTTKSIIVIINPSNDFPCQVLGIEDNIQLMAYPNPTTHQLTLKLPHAQGQASAQVFTITGKQVWHKAILFQGKEGKIDINELRPGHYILRIHHKGYFWQTNFIKID